MIRSLGWLTRGSEFVAAMALAAIFITFLVQIFSRYAAKIAWLMPIPPISEWMATLEPVGWTVNLISLLWVWIIFFSCSFFVQEKDHVTFDIVYLAMQRRGRKVLATITALIMIFVMIYSFGPTWDAFFGSRLMELKKIQTLRIPITGEKIAIKWLFASYLLLMVAVITRYVWRLYTIFRHDPPGGELDDLSWPEHTVAEAPHER